MDRTSNNQKRIVQISLIRILAIFLVLICHPLNHSETLKSFAPLANIGPSLFLMVSVYLFAGKNIGSFKLWFIQRIKTVCIPPLIASVVVLLLLTITGAAVSTSNAIVALLNLTGISFLFPDLYAVFPYSSELAHLWFITVILVCYLLVPLLKKICWEKAGTLKILIVFALVFVLNELLETRYIAKLSYLLLFVLGYILIELIRRCQRSLVAVKKPDSFSLR